MKVNIKEMDGKHVVTLDGELDTLAAAEVEEVLAPLYTSDGKDIIFDCSRLEYIASSGLRIIMAILKGAQSGGCKVVLRHVNDDIKSVFEMIGFSRLFIFE